MSSIPAQPYEKFGKYVLLEKIAVGGMAEVYLAKSAVANGLNKFVAVKRILPQFSSNEEFIDMFKEEAKVAINLNHGNIVSIYDFGVEKNQFFLVMEFMEGRNLRQIINELKKNNRSFSIDQAIFIIKEVAAGLDHAHRCVDANSGRPLNITHRDMSPQNIMLSFEGEVKVIDFGIAKAETEKEETKAGTLKGKFSYMSPEQAEGMPIDPRTDVFALGIILWELLANDRLFTGSNEAAILRKVRECQIPQIRKVNPLVPPELERIAMKALAKDKNVRYQTAANFHRDLNRFLNTQFPDFSSHDFSQSLKDSFRTAFADAREKLILYSKVEILELINTNQRQTAVTIKKVVNSEAIPTQAKHTEQVAQQQIAKSTAEKEINRPPIPDMQNITPLPDEMPDGYNEQNLKTNLEGLRGSFVQKKGPTAASASSSFKGGASASQPPGPKISSNSSIHHTRVTQMSQISFQKPNSSGNDFVEIGFKIFIFAILVGGGFWGYKNGFKFNTSESISTQLVAGKTETTDSKIKGEIDISSTAAVTYVKASISSSPAGAQIYIDNFNTGYRTPAVISMTANKDSLITLKKDGYLTYEISKKLNETSLIAATLQVAAQTGFINISIANGGPSTIIYVNGKELSEKAPILKYSILANADTAIRAYNPITRQADELKVNVHSGENKNIELILGRIPVKK
ncbi:MAG: serine/threonine-protein kinase [Pseudobdellovibrio sp.]